MGSIINFERTHASISSNVLEIIEQVKKDVMDAFPNICVEFAEAKFTQNIFETAKRISESISKVTTEKLQVEQSKNQVKIDSTKYYKFIVYNKDWYYRVFEIEISNTYPITLYLDYEILLQSKVDCFTEDQFKQNLNKIFNSREVISIMDNLSQYR